MMFFVELALKMAFSLPVVFGLPAALCFPVDIRLFLLVRDKTDGWYSLADAAGADDDGVSSILGFKSPILSTQFLAIPTFLVLFKNQLKKGNK